MRRSRPIPADTLRLALPTIPPLTLHGAIPLSPAMRRKLPPAVETGIVIVGIIRRIGVWFATLVIPPRLPAVIPTKRLSAHNGAMGQRFPAVAALGGLCFLAFAAVAVFPHNPAPFRTNASSSSGRTTTNSSLCRRVEAWAMCCLTVSRRFPSGTIQTTNGNTPLWRCSAFVA